MSKMMTMKGPTARLERIGLRIGRAGQELPDRISKAVEKRVPQLIEGGYQTRSSPYGTPWPKPKAGNPPMERTGKGGGKLRKSYEVIRIVGGLRWVVWASNKARSKGGAYYGGILQKGFTHYRGGFVAARKQVPDTKQLPPRWAGPLRQDVEREGQQWAREVGR